MDEPSNEEVIKPVEDFINSRLKEELKAVLESQQKLKQLMQD
jgi:hypothetical protein